MFQETEINFDRLKFIGTLFGASELNWFAQRHKECGKEITS